MTKFVLVTAILFTILTIGLSLISSAVIRRAYIGRVRETVSSLVYGQAEILSPEDFNKGNPDKAKEIFRRVQASISQTIELARIKVWDPQATVIYSDEENLIGKVFSDNHEVAEAVSLRTVVSEIVTPGTGETVTEGGLGPLLEVYVPLNYTGYDTPVGVIETYFYLDEINSQILQIQRILVATVVVFAVVTYVLLYFFFRHFFYEPLLRLKEAAMVIESGDLRKRVSPVTRDEVGVVAASFNSMATKLQSYTGDLETKVKERTEFIRKVIDTDPNLIFVKDSNLRFALVNEAAARAFGHLPDEVLGKNEIEIGLNREQAQRLMEDDRAALESGILKFSPETELTNPENGESRWFQVIRLPIKEKDKVSILVVANDITVRKKADERSKELDALKNKFVKITSHQMRTPLSSIAWNLELILGGDVGQVDKAQEQILRSVYKANREVISRIDDFLVAMDIEEGKASLDKEEVQLESVVNAVVETYKPQIEIKKLEYQIKLPEQTLPKIEADSEKLRKVIEKLIDNAISYTPEAGKLTVSISRNEATAKVEVIDTGVGIPETEKSTIFGRFQRASNAFTMKPDSSGLGLYIAKHFVELHGGSIGFSSQEGKGSTFWFELPLLTQEHS